VTVLSLLDGQLRLIASEPEIPLPRLFLLFSEARERERAAQSFEPFHKGCSSPSEVTALQHEPERQVSGGPL